MSARDDYPDDFGMADSIAMTALGVDAYECMCDELDRLRTEVERLRGPRSLPGWMIIRRNGRSAGPFHTRGEAEDYLNPGDSVVPVKATPGAFRKVESRP